MRCSTIMSWAFAALATVATAAPAAQVGLPVVGGLIPGVSGILGVVAVLEVELGVLSLSRQSTIIGVCTSLGLDIQISTVRELFVGLLVQNPGLIVTIEAEVVGIFVPIGLDFGSSTIVAVVAELDITVDDPVDDLIKKCGLTQ
ncbi:hypothetical protein EJ03DRAFT_94730 [Teratosphaeria nubilosa]|uniref:Hydrophobin n=1 Tax=Teratosphaeria nubilosa TaxID=161662 RepID=A0A6G1L925_9PEZI|nr:hypothetical protein EJ03DRAFT_94730 [Teratosphaeria nubilosa]